MATVVCKICNICQHCKSFWHVLNSTVKRRFQFIYIKVNVELANIYIVYNIIFYKYLSFFTIAINVVHVG